MFSHVKNINVPFVKHSAHNNIYFMIVMFSTFFLGNVFGEYSVNGSNSINVDMNIKSSPLKVTTKKTLAHPLSLPK